MSDPGYGMEATLLQRRGFLRLAGAAATVLVWRAPADEVDPTEPGTTEPTPTKFPTPEGAIDRLPGDGNLLAWTVDDGFNTTCIRRYIEFAATSGTRLTFFVIGRCRSWRDVAPELAPFVASGQIQLGNHSFSHTPLTRLKDAKIISDLQRNHDLILNTYGVDCRPFYRPPGGSRSPRTDSAAASIGYTVPVMWHGVLEPASGLTKQKVIQSATKSFNAQAIVLGHLNQLTATKVFPELEAIITSRGLQTVTLNDVFSV